MQPIQETPRRTAGWTVTAGRPRACEPSPDRRAVAPLLACLLLECADAVSGPDPAGAPGRSETRCLRLWASGALLRVPAVYRPDSVERWTGECWEPLAHPELVALTAREMGLRTGLANEALAEEMAESLRAVRALTAARARGTAPADPWLRSEHALLTGHPSHPAPKARGGLPPDSWLPYAPEAHARFPLVLLGVREDAVVEEGDTRALDVLGEAPPGYRLLPAHPWQLLLVDGLPAVKAAFADGTLLRLGETERAAVPTASVRTLHLPGPDAADPGLGLKFSLDVRITNDVRRLWSHDLDRLVPVDTEVAAAMAAGRGGGGWLSDRGYRTVAGLVEEFAVIVRDAPGLHLPAGSGALLPAALAEGFEGSPWDLPVDPARWWEAYLRCVVPPVLELFARDGLVLECHLQNTLIAVDASGTPVRALFRDPEGVKRISEAGRAAGWERLVYCLVVNHLSELAGALAARFPEAAPGLWPAARAEFLRCAADLPELPEAAALPDAPTVPAKANLVLRWTGADGADARYLPVPNPLGLPAG